MTFWKMRENYRNCSVLCCVWQWHAHTWAVSAVNYWFRFVPCRRLWINSNNLSSNSHILEVWSWCWVLTNQWVIPIAFSSLTLLVRGQEKHLGCKMKWSSAGIISVWSEVQIICIWFSWCHCHPIISCFIEIQNGFTFLMPAYPGCPGKEAVKQVSMSVCETDNIWKVQWMIFAGCCQCFEFKCFDTVGWATRTWRLNYTTVPA